MLKNIPAIISPDLLKVLCEMGHGDTIVIADGNFPCVSIAGSTECNVNASNPVAHNSIDASANSGNSYATSSAATACNTAVVIRCDGLGVPELLRAILKLIPLDTYVDAPVTLMGVAKGAEQIDVPIWDEFRSIVSEFDERGAAAFRTVDRFAFYEEAKQAFAVVATSEAARYANIILKKGVVINE